MISPMDTTFSSNQQILYSTLGGLQPGGTCLSWIAGLTVCEALRLTQRFDDNTSKARRSFVYFGLLMAVSMAGVLAVILYYYCVVSYGNYQRLTTMTDISRCHFLLGKIASWGGIIFYSHLVWNTELGRLKISRIPIVKMIILSIIAISAVLYMFAVVWVFSSPSLAATRKHWHVMYWTPYIQLFCELFLTLMKAYDLGKSNTIRQVLIYKDKPLRYASSILCLLCQTAIFPTIFDLILICRIDGHSPGIAYTLVSLSAELHLFGPIMAISAALDSECLNDRASTCSVARNEYDADKPKPPKRLTFQQ